MTERSIILRDWEVQAVLEGRKTRVTEPIIPQPRGDGFNAMTWGDVRRCEQLFKCVGDRLWVRETWCKLMHTSPQTDEPIEVTNGDRLIEPATSYLDDQGRKRWHYDGLLVVYRATTDVTFCDGDGFSGSGANRDDMPRWKSPACMPREYSRITLEVTGVRVQRVQEISEDECEKEGLLSGEVVDSDFPRMIGDESRSFIHFKYDVTELFVEAWDSRYAKRGLGWDTNPWVVVREFRRVEG